MKRISRGTPYVLTQTDIDNALAALTPRIEESIAAAMDMTPEDWRKQTKARKVKQIIDHQTRGQLAASMNAANRAQTDFEESAKAISATHEVEVLREEIAALTALVQSMTGTAKKGRK